MTNPTRPPLRNVPLFLRCTRCAGPFRAIGSFLDARVVTCVWCGQALCLRPVEPSAPSRANLG